MSYTTLHVHTEYSNLRLLDCINKVESVIQYAQDMIIDISNQYKNC